MDIASSEIPAPFLFFSPSSFRNQDPSFQILIGSYHVTEVGSKHGLIKLKISKKLAPTSDLDCANRYRFPLVLGTSLRLVHCLEHEKKIEISYKHNKHVNINKQ